MQTLVLESCEANVKHGSEYDTERNLVSGLV